MDTAFHIANYTSAKNTMPKNKNKKEMQEQKY